MLVSPRSRTVRAGLLGAATIVLLVFGVIACAGPGAPPHDDTDLRASLTSPSDTAYVAGSITVQVDVEGDPDVVRLLRDGEAFVTLSPPYTYVWDTTAEPEGSYALQARAQRGAITVESDARTVIVDRTRPTVVERRPRPADANVWHAEPITVTFSEALLASTVSPGTVVLEAVGGTELDVSLELDTAGVVLTVTPDESLPIPVQLRLSVSDAITDLAGNALIAPAAWTWSLPAWQWMGASELRVEAELLSLQSRLAVTPDGHPVIVWLEEMGATKAPVDVRVASWDGSSWVVLGDPLNGPDRLSAMYGMQDVAVASDGTVYVAWYEAVFGSQYHVWVHRWDGEAWHVHGGAPLNDGGDPAGPGIAIAVGSDDRPVVAWTAQVGTGSDALEVRVMRWTGSAWEGVGAARRRDPDRGAFSPHLTRDAHDALVLTWSERVQEGSEFSVDVYAERWSGSAWTALGGGLRGSLSSARGSQAAVAADGSVFVGFVAESGWYVVRRWQPAHGVWVTVGQLRDDDTGTVQNGSLTVDLGGRTVALWHESRPGGDAGTQYHDVVRRYEHGAWRSIGEDLAAPSRRVQGHVTVADDGTVFVSAHVPSEATPGRTTPRVYRSNVLP